MDKHIKNTIEKFIKRETDLYAKYGESRSGRESVMFKKEYMKVNIELSNYLRSLIGDPQNLSEVDRVNLKNYLKRIAVGVTKAAKNEIALSKFIAKANSDESKITAKTYFDVVEDFEQTGFGIKWQTMQEVKKLLKFGKELNKAKKPEDRKNMVSVFMCKFKKSKLQTSSHENSAGRDDKKHDNNVSNQKLDAEPENK